MNLESIILNIGGDVRDRTAVLKPLLLASTCLAKL